MESKEEVERAPPFPTARGVAPAGTWAAVPLVVPRRSVGALTLEMPSWGPLSADDKTFLLAAAGHVALAVDRVGLVEREREKRILAQAAEKRRTALQEISDAALSHLQIDPLLNELLSRVRRIFECDTATILLADSDQKQIRVRACNGIERDAWEQVAVPWGVGVAGEIVAKRRPVLVPELTGSELWSPVLKRRLRSMMGVPMELDGRTIGVLHVGFSRPRSYSAEDVALLQMVAARVALALGRAEVHDALRLMEHRLRLALLSGGMGVWEWAVPTGRLTWSRAVEEMHGYPPGQSPGTLENYLERVHPQDRESLLTMLDETVTEDREFHFEHRFLRPDGEFRWVAGHGTVVDRVESRPSLVMGVCADVTDRKQAAQAVEDSESRLRAVLEAAIHGVVTLDEDGVIESVNPAAERLFAQPSSELVGRRFSDLMPEPFRTEHEAYLDAGRRGETAGMLGVRREVLARRHDGTEFAMELALSDFGKSGRRRFAGILIDIGERKRLEAAREAAVAELQQTLNLNETFAGILAHDLRNPLGAMLMATELVLTRSGPDADGPTAPLRRVLTSGQRMARMIDQLLDFTRARVGGGFRIEPMMIDLGEVCDEVLGELAIAHPEWRMTIDRLGRLYGCWDRDRLVQLLSNLVTNAGQHGTPGAPVQIVLDGKADHSLRMEVRNRGVIPPHLLPDVFSPFRGRNQRRGAGSGGLGLGLYIAQEIARAHGGAITVASSEAEGTAFTVHLPRHPTAPAPA